MNGALLSVKDLEVRFGTFTALQNIDFELNASETLGLVGESGSGKSTLARALMRLLPISGGGISWSGENVLAWNPRELRKRRRDLQMVFQDPLASLNPRMTAGDAVAEPLKIFESSLSTTSMRMRVFEMLERVGLSPTMASRYPHELSGGQCQRIGIARAMILRPKLLICDEPVSSLDVSVQGQIVNLLSELQRECGIAMVFISHNLAVVRHLSHRVLVIYRGRPVEIAPRESLFAAPVHPYTRALLAAVPDPTRGFAARTLTTVGEMPANHESTSGCAFYGRCPHGRAACLDSSPTLQTLDGGHMVACHRWRELVYS